MSISPHYIEVFVSDDNNDSIVETYSPKLFIKLLSIILSAYTAIYCSSIPQHLIKKGIKQQSVPYPPVYSSK